MADGLLLNSATPSPLVINHMTSLGLLLHLNPMPPCVLVLLNHSPWPHSSNAAPISLYLSGADQEDMRRREAKVVVESLPRPEESLATAGVIEESWWWLDPVEEGHWWPDPVGEGRQRPDLAGKDREGGSLGWIGVEQVPVVMWKPPAKWGGEDGGADGGRTRRTRSASPEVSR